MADRNPEYDSDPGNDTKDYVFLLSDSEAREYYIEKERKLYGGTAYANKLKYSHSLKEIKRPTSCLWSLRTPGKNNKAIEVVSTGCFGMFAKQKPKIYVDSTDPLGMKEYIRPAIWIDLDA